MAGPVPISIPAVLECESTLTAKYQTTVPQEVRDVLKLSKSDKLRYVIRGDRSVVMEKVDFIEQEQEADPILTGFLSFLERDMKAHPAHIVALSQNLVAQAQDLVHGVSVDLDAPLADDDDE